MVKVMYNDQLLYKVVIWVFFGISLWTEKVALRSEENCEHAMVDKCCEMVYGAKADPAVCTNLDGNCLVPVALHGFICVCISLFGTFAISFCIA